MPKEKSCTQLVRRIYKVNAENIMLFTWVNAQKQIVPAITLEQSIWSFFRVTGINDWDIESAMATFGRLQKEYYEDCKSETT